MKKFAKVTAREVLENFQSDSEYGLSNTSVASLAKIHGSNKIAEEEKVCLLKFESRTHPKCNAFYLGSYCHSLFPTF